MAESSPRIFGVHHAYGPQVTPGGEKKKRGREARLSLSVFSGASKQRRCVRVLVRGGGFPRRRTTEGRAPLAGHPAGFVDLRSSAERGRRLARSPREGPRSSRTARLLAPLVLRAGKRRRAPRRWDTFARHHQRVWGEGEGLAAELRTRCEIQRHVA